MAREPKVMSDDRAFLLLKEKSKPKYIKCWRAFRAWIEDHEDFTGSFEEAWPEEDLVMEYFGYLHSVDGMDFHVSTIWTLFSMINGIFKAKYGKKLQDAYVRLQAFISAWEAETVKKAPVFEYKDIMAFLSDKK